MAFDLFYLFVENVFGSWILATLGFLTLFLILGMFARMSWTLLFIFCILFIVASLLVFAGIGAFIVFAIISAFYFGASVIRFFNNMV